MEIIVYKDPYIYPETPIVVGYKGWVRNQKNMDEMRIKLAALDYNSLSDLEKESYILFSEDVSRWDAGDHSDGDVGFFYCPYIALKNEDEFHYCPPF